MRKILAVIGRPGVGKTTLFKKIIDEQKDWIAKEPVKLVPTLYNEKYDCHILGKYEEGEIFAGTDRMSMAVQPAAVDFISNCNSNIIFEGDRLTNSKFFNFLSSLPDTEFKIIVLTADEKLLTERYSDRGSDQSETFLKGRKSKISNIQTNMDFLFIIESYSNNTLDDQKIILDKINSFLF
jgi:broad-specificity NMP kinase